MADKRDNQRDLSSHSPGGKDALFEAQHKYALSKVKSIWKESSGPKRDAYGIDWAAVRKHNREKYGSVEKVRRGPDWQTNLIEPPGTNEDSVIAKSRRQDEAAIEKVNAARQSQGLGNLTNEEINNSVTRAKAITSQMLGHYEGIGERETMAIFNAKAFSKSMQDDKFNLGSLWILGESRGFTVQEQAQMQQLYNIMNRKPTSAELRVYDESITSHKLGSYTKAVKRGGKIEGDLARVGNAIEQLKSNRINAFLSANGSLHSAMLNAVDEEGKPIFKAAGGALARSAEDAQTAREFMRRSAMIDPKDEYEYNYRRLSVLEHIDKNLGGYESYQMANSIHRPEDMNDSYLASNRIRRRMTKDSIEYYGPNGQLTLTYDRHGRPVYAEMGAKPDDMWLTRGEGTERFTHLNMDQVWMDTAPGSEWDRNQFDRMVLTNYGAQRTEAIDGLRPQIAEHKQLVQDLFDSMKAAKAEKAYEHIQLTELAQKQLGFTEKSVSAPVLMNAMNKYLNGNPMSSLTAPVHGDTVERTFRNLDGFMYSLNSEAFYNPLLRERTQWAQNARDVNGNRLELHNKFGVLTEGDDGKEELDSEAYKRKLHEDTSRLTRELDFNERALELQEEAGRRNPQATQKVVNSVIANMGADTDEQRNLESWVAGKRRLDESGMVLRQAGDKVPIRVANIDEATGIITGERLRLEPTKISMRMQVEDNLQMLESIREATVNHNSSVRQSISDDYQTAITKIVRNTAIGVTADRETGAFTKVLSKEAFLHEIMTSEQVKLDIGQGKASVNAHVANIIATRAPWLISNRNDHNVVAQAANIALMEAINESREIKLTQRNAKAGDAMRGLKGDIVTKFDESLENLFVKNLHRQYFDDVADEGGNRGAAANLVRKIKNVVEERDAAEGREIHPAQRSAYLTAEIGRLLNPSTEAGQLINKEFRYMDDVFSPDFIARAIDESTATGGAPKISQIEDIDQRADLAMRGEDRSAYDAVMDGGNNELADNTSRGQERWLQEQTTESYEELRTRFAERAPGQTDLDVYRQFAKDLAERHTIRDTETKAIIRDGKPVAMNIMNGLMNYGGIGAGEHDLTLNTFKDLHGTATERKITSANDLRNILLLREQAGEGSKFQFFHQFDDGRREVEMWLGRDDSALGNRLDELDENREILARVKGTNVTYRVSDSNDPNNRISFSAYQSPYDRDREVKAARVVDGSSPIITNNAEFPLEVNPKYNVNRVNASAGGGYLSSSSFGTLRNIEAFRVGLKDGVALDYETTGLMTDTQMVKDGLVLPTELSGRFARWDEATQSIVHENAGHYFYDVGSHQLAGGGTVEDMVRGFSAANAEGTLSSSMILGTLGKDAPWESLTEAERSRVLQNGRVGLMRNLAKYSDMDNMELKAQLSDFRYTPSNLNSFMDNLAEQAQRGINNLRNGMGIEGAKVINTLKDMDQAYKTMTDGRILIGHNVRDADVEWARQFASMAGQELPKASPEVIDTLHVSRIIDAGQRAHSLDAIRGRHGSLFESGTAHMADVDTRDTLSFLSHGMKELEASGLDSPEGLTGDHWLAKLNARGGDYIQNDLYKVASRPGDDLFNPDTGMYELKVQRMGAAADDVVDEVISGRSMQELNMSIGRNYKGFTSRDDADEFLKNMEFDQARREVSESRGSLNDFRKWEQRLAGGAGHEALADAASAADPSDTFGLKVLQNADLAGEAPAMSKIQERIAPRVAGYIGSEDAKFQRQFLEEVDNLKAAGVVNKDSSKELIEDFNRKIIQKAQAAGVQPAKHAVPGFIDLGRVGRRADGSYNAEKYGAVTGKHITAMANTYMQAENSVWEMADKFAPLVAEDAPDRRQASLAHAMNFMKEAGMLPSSYQVNPQAPVMDDAVQGLMDHLARNGSGEVIDITQPLIAGENADVMRSIYQGTMDEVLAPRMALLDDDPNARSSYENTKAMREQFKAAGMDVSGLNAHMGSTYAGESIPMLGGNIAPGMNAAEMRQAIDAGAENSRELWREIAKRASSNSGVFSDTMDAQEALGWVSRDADGNFVPNRADKFIHPLGENAGMLYNEMEEGTIRGLRAGFSQPSDPLTESAYMNRVKGQFGVFDAQREEGLFESAAPSKVQERALMERDGAVIRNAINRVNTEYIDADEFDRIGGAAMPDSWANRSMEAATENTRRAMVSAVEHIKAHPVGYGVGAGIVAAGFMIRQWTRGDNIRPDERPGHNQTADTGGSFEKSQSKPWDGQMKQPLQQSALLAPTGQSKGYDVKVHARNPGNLSNDQIGQALNQGAQGAAINVHHQDDTSSIGGEWLSNKFAELLSNGRVN